MEGDAMERRTFWLLSAAVVLVALALREMYVLQVQVWNPMAGDAGSYVRYAHNLHRGFFGAGDVPDAYRPPGYPVMIALAQMLGGDTYGRVLQWQAFMGTATVGLTIAIGQRCLPSWAALLAGLLMAFWPHHIAFSAEILTEVPTGFLLTAALWVACVAGARVWVWLVAGLLFAAATMMNTVCLFVPLFAGVAMIGRRAPRLWAVLLLPVLVTVGGWSMRPVDGGSDRIWMNLVQGSQPMYHEAYSRHQSDPAMARLNTAIDAEAHAAVDDPAEALRNVAARIAERPGHYLAWYASKPWLLWNWDVRVSAVGGPYVHRADNSTLEVAPLRQVSTALRVLNPALFVLALLGAVYAVIRPGPARMLGLAFLYVTAVHLVLQAEPRYSIPFRPVEMLLAMSSIAWAVKRSTRRTPTVPS